MTLLTDLEMIPETTGVKIRLNTKRPHTKKIKNKSRHDIAEILLKLPINQPTKTNNKQ